MQKYFLSLILSLACGVQAAEKSAPTLLPKDGENQALPDIAIQAMASRIDALLATAWKTKAINAAAPIDDAAFLRRAYTEIAGRIPTLNEIKSYEDDKRSNRRTELIKKLLHSPAAVSHEFNLWADTLRVKSQLPENMPSSGNWQEWLKQALAKDMPWNKMAHDMIAADGHALQTGNGATGYLLRDRGMPLDNMANTMRIFLGTSMVCAQCHDHPFNDTSQHEFYKLAAFSGGLQYQGKLPQTDINKEPRAKIMEARAEIGEAMKKDKNLRITLIRLQKISTIGIAGTGTGTIRLPKDYKYEDAKPGDLVLAETPFGSKINLPFSESDIAKDMKKEDAKNSDQQNNKTPGPLAPGRQLDSRLTFADWVSSPDNPMFTRTIVNRLWARVMGQGLIPHLDDLAMNDLGEVPGLMVELEKDMKILGFRMSEFRRVLYSTKAWQMKAYTGDPTRYLFQGPLLRRMSPEQTWDSLVALAQPDPEACTAQIDEETAEQLRIFPLVKGKSPLEIFAIAKAIEADGWKAWVEKNAPAPAAEKAAELSLAQNTAIKNKKRNYKDDLLLRASEQPQPAPAGHFLARFGQSEREDIDASCLEVSVPQALSLMNGEIERLITKNSNSLLMNELEAQSKPKDIINMAYKAILCRNPSTSETARFLPCLKGDKIKGSEDIIWTLINSNEFLFRR